MDDAARNDGRVAVESRPATRCVSCSRALDASFLYCPYCGRRLSQPGGPEMKWYYSRYAVAMGLGTIGPFALPLVWFNPRYTLPTKITLTVLVLALTAAIVYGLIWLCMQMAGLLGQLTTMY